MARNIQPNEMVGSVLFTTVAPKIKSISNERLLFELCLASTRTDVNHTISKDLSGAVVWNGTPQGHAFWHKLERECLGIRND